MKKGSRGSAFLLYFSLCTHFAHNITPQSQTRLEKSFCAKRNITAVIPVIGEEPRDVNNCWVLWCDNVSTKLLK